MKEAQQRLKGFVHETPLEHSKTFSDLAGADVYLKLENLQKTGAFKIRGAMNKISRLTEAERKRGLVTASAGNHAQGVAMAAAYFGVPATVFMPDGAPMSKIQATESYGARVMVGGAGYDEACEAAERMAAEHGSTFVHAFDDPDIIAGQGTVALEILHRLPAAEVLIVPIGGGGLAAGTALAAKSWKPGIRIVGVQPEGANSAFLSNNAGSLQRITQPKSIADGLCVKQPGALPFEIIHTLVDDIVTVSEEEILEAMRLLLERSKHLVEGAGASGLAALLGGKAGAAGKTAAVLVSGGNLDLAKLPLLCRTETSTQQAVGR